MKALRARTILAIALALTLSQAAAICALAPSSTPSPRWQSLLQGDSRWYAKILREGYRSRFPPAWYEDYAEPHNLVAECPSIHTDEINA